MKLMKDTQTYPDISDESGHVLFRNGAREQVDSKEEEEFSHLVKRFGEVSVILFVHLGIFNKCEC